MESNATGEVNKTYDYDYEYELLPGAKESFYIALGMQWVNAGLIISLNTAVIITVLRYKKKSRLYFLLMNMAIAVLRAEPVKKRMLLLFMSGGGVYILFHLTTGLIDALVNALERTLGIEYLNYWWFGGDIFCRLQRTLSSVSLCASNFILAATSVDRALVVAKPMLSFKRGYKLQKILILVCWLVSAAISCPLLIIHFQVYFDPKYIDGPQKIPLCSDALDTNGWKVYFYLLLMFYFLIPLTVIIVSYTILIFAIYKRARTPPNSVRGVDNLRISLVFNKGLPSSKARSIKLSFGIVLSFIGSWTPFFVVLYMNIFHNFSDPVIMPFITTYYWNCSVNPVIFFVFHRRRATGTPSSLYSSDTPMSKLTSSQRTSARELRDSETMPLHQKNNC